MRLPDWCEAVIGTSFAARSNAASKLPALSTISASIYINLGLAQISRNAVSCAKDSSLRILSNCSWKLIKVWLVSQSPIVNCILDLSDLSPLDTTICRTVDGEVNQRGLRGVVLPGCKQRAVRELDGPGIENARVCPASVGRRREDDIIGEC